MSRLNYKLPPMTMLVAFESAARLTSFKRAASELGVTPGAVSHQIKALEKEIGTALFFRRHRGVELTTCGLELFSSLGQAFTEIGSTLQHIRSQTLDKPVVVGSTTAVSSLWITPALMKFGRENGAMIVNQLVSDTWFQGTETPDLFISYGRQEQDGLKQDVIYRDTLVPVCGPALATRLRREIANDEGDIDLHTFAEQRLIHLDARDRNWTTWESWFHNLGYSGEIASSMRVNSYMIALQAAQDDAGILLGWKRLIQPLLENGRLELFGKWSVPAPHRFYLVSQPLDKLSSQSLLLRQWLIDVL